MLHTPNHNLVATRSSTNNSEAMQQNKNVFTAQSDHKESIFGSNKIVQSKQQQFNGPNACARPYVVVTKWAYPYGGGEQFMRQTMSLMQPQNCVWLCFYSARNEVFANHCVSTLFEKTKGLCTMIGIPGGFSERKLYCWLRLLQPDVVHCQGNFRQEIERAIGALNIPLISGFHFWHGMVNLNERQSNVRIINNAETHQMDPNYRHTERQADVIYGPSFFFRDAVAAIGGPRRANRIQVLPCMPDEQDIKIDLEFRGRKLFPKDDFARFSQGFVSLVNIHERKGGRLFLHLAKHLPREIGLLGVRTDVFETNLDRQINAEVEKRDNVFIIGRVDSIGKVFARTAILLQPSECDETFCRVLAEAHYNSIPTLSSDYGNLPYLHVTEDAKKRCIVANARVRDFSPQYYGMWREKIMNEWKNLRDGTLAKICRHNYDQLKLNFDTNNKFYSLIDLARQGRTERSKRVALFAPWCDQGLGIQTRNYAKILRDAGFKVFVFSFMPYTGKREQAEPSEWCLQDIDVYYSPHHREQVTSQEIVAFALRTRIAFALIAETCWHRVFSMMRELKRVNVKTIAVPNVEIVRKDEIEKHRVFDLLIMNNRSCENLFLRHGFPAHKLRYVGYSIDKKVDEKLPEIERTKSGRTILRLLILGGRNAISRKHVDVTVASFLENVSESAPIKLIATSQKPCDELKALKSQIEQEKRQEQVQIIVGNLTQEHVHQLYYSCDIVLQISKHEGLGLGFFEAQTFNKPILTLNIQPHNECAPTSVAWHLEPDKMIENDENNSCGVLSALVTKETLRPWFQELSGKLENHLTAVEWWRNDYAPKREAIAPFFVKRDAQFRQKFVDIFQDI